jgi:hypothetical protein
MSETAPLRIAAQDADDLRILSAAAQDGLFMVRDAQWLPKARRFTLRLQRFRWEAGKAQRVWAALAFEDVLAVKAQRIGQSRPDAFASLLAIGFEPAGDPPGGMITLSLADGGAIALDVECVDATLTDLGDPRDAAATPVHD